MEKLFEMATRNRVRFPYKGMVSVEDLWDLSVTELDKIYKTLNKAVKQSDEESLLNVKTKEDEALTVQIEIVKYIVSVKLAETEAKSKAREIKEQKQKLLAIKVSKEDEALKNMSIEEIDKMLNELN